jgi:hypothetical protein
MILGESVDGYGLLNCSFHVPAGRVSEMRKQSVDAGLLLRRAKIEFRLAIFSRNRICGLESEYLDWICRSPMNQPEA